MIKHSIVVCLLEGTIQQKQNTVKKYGHEMYNYWTMSYQYFLTSSSSVTMLCMEMYNMSRYEAYKTNLFIINSTLVMYNINNRESR